MVRVMMWSCVVCGVVCVCVCVCARVCVRGVYELVPVLFQRPVRLRASVTLPTPKSSSVTIAPCTFHVPISRWGYLLGSGLGLGLGLRLGAGLGLGLGLRLGLGLGA